MMPILKFNEAECQAASDSWNLNCGPSALAAILGKTLEEIKWACMSVDFAERGYMNSTMMANALTCLGVTAKPNRLRLDRRTECDVDSLPKHGLARIQFGGPWIINGKPARWAAQHTHWVASWKIAPGVIRFDPVCLVFDINGGIMEYARWESEILPAITASIKRCDGEWFVTNSWEVQ